MKSALLVSLFLAVPAFATGFPQPKKVTCIVLSEVNGAPQADQTFEMSVAGLESCESTSEDFKVAGTDLTLSTSYSAACQRPGGTSYPEHIQGPAFVGPSGSGVYARAFRLSGSYVTKSSLQLTATVNGKKDNVIAHCELAP